MDASSLALVADIGGTNARFGLIERGSFKIHHRHAAFTRDDPSLEAALERWLDELGARPRAAALAVAGPVTADRFTFTNSPWTFSRAEIAKRFGFEDLVILNDFEALALSLPHLKDAALQQIGGGEPEPRQAKAVVGAGTGLGVGALAPAGEGWIAVPSEGGHIGFTPETEQDLAVLKALGATGDRVSAEQMISGPALAMLYGLLADIAGETREKLEGAAITQLGLARTDPIAVAALDLFAVWLGRFAGDMALAFCARGGVYLGGGVAPKIASLLMEGRFRAAFEAKGRLAGFVKPIPVYVIMTGDAPLIGAATKLS